jgi:hypothetical protein
VLLSSTAAAWFFSHSFYFTAAADPALSMRFFLKLQSFIAAGGTS